MRSDRKIDVSFSAAAEDFIRRFMKVAEKTMPNASLVPAIDWYLSRKFTDKVTGKVTDFGPGIGVGAIEAEKLTDELIVPMAGFRSQFASRKNCNPPIGRHSIFWTILLSSPPIDVQPVPWFCCPVLPRRRRIPDMFGGHKRIDPQTIARSWPC